MIEKQTLNPKSAHPFGMSVSNREFFRFRNYKYGGANGQEKDDEITGVMGSHYASEYWEYDARLGCRWNRDLVVKPSQSPWYEKRLGEKDDNWKTREERKTHTE